MIKYRKQLSQSAAFLMITLLGGCDLLQKAGLGGGSSATQESQPSSGAKDASKVLCSINGEAVITEQEFTKNLNQMIESNPYFRGATADQLPKELQRRFFDQLVTQALIEKHAIAQGADKGADFVKSFEETKKLLKRTLLVQAVEKEIYESITIPESEIKKYFDENKERFVKAPGGTLAMGVKFETDFAADLFMNKVKANLGNFEKLGKDEKAGKFRDFGRVSKEANRNMQVDVVPGPIKDAVASMSKLPGVQKVKVGKDVWVVKAWDKKDAELFALAEVKEHVEGMLKNNKFRDELDKEIAKVKEKFKIETNDEFFKGDEPADKEDLDDAHDDEKAPAAASAA